METLKKSQSRKRGTLPNVEHTLSTILSKDEENSPAASGANIGAVPARNEALKPVYDKMHSEGPGAWFGTGEQERALILKMGEPWEGLNTLEIGCGEGELSSMMHENGARVMGIDYSDVAIEKCVWRIKKDLLFVSGPYRKLENKRNRLVLQGVLEHLDDPFRELQWMMDNLLTKDGDVITSSPGFINPRGFVWMTLNMLGAVMSKTDLHFLNPWDFEEFCQKHGYGLAFETTDFSWASGPQMIQDFLDRLPKALRDGNIPYDELKLTQFLMWLEKAGNRAALGHDGGASIVYRITRGG